MCNNNLQSVEVSFVDLSMMHPQIAIWLADEPSILIECFNTVLLSLPPHLQALKKVVLEEFPNYEQIHADLFIRIRDLPVIDKLRELRSSHLRSLIRTQGVITRRSGVFPQMVYAAFRCGFCGMIVDGIKQATDREIRPDMCVFCQRKGAALFPALF